MRLEALPRGKASDLTIATAALSDQQVHTEQSASSNMAGTPVLLNWKNTRLLSDPHSL